MANTAAQDESPSFENALQELETIVDAMENGETPLAEMVAQFEKGTKLLKICQSRLNEAETKIEKLKVENDAFQLEAFDPEAES